MSAAAGPAVQSVAAPRQVAGTRRRAGFPHALGAIVALALLVRVVVVLATPFTPRTDAADYDRIAVSLVQNGGFPSSLLVSGSPTAFRPPLFPVALASVYELAGVGSGPGRWEAARMLEALLGAITVALSSLIALRLWGRRAALLSGAIAGLYPPLVLIGTSLMSESLYVPLVLAAVLAALHTRERSAPGSGRQLRWRQLRWAAATGVLVGLAAMTRSNGIALLAPIAALVWNGRPWRAWPALRVPLVVVLATALTALPWTVRNAHIFGQFVPISTESGYALAGTYDRYAAQRSDFPAFWYPPVDTVAQQLALHPRLNEAGLSDRLTTVALDYVGRHPAYPLKVAYWNTLRLLDLTGTGVERWAARYEAYPKWLSSLSVYAFWVLGVVALAGAVLRAGRGAPWAFWACPAILFASTVLVLGATRYRAPVDPFLVILAALTLLGGWRRRTPVASPAA